MKTELISPEELRSKISNSSNSNCRLIDVRTPAEFETAHIDAALNLPLGSPELTSYIQSKKNSGDIIYVTCQKGGRANTACEEFSQAGIETRNLKGGMSAWIDAGLPVVQGKESISLERQVRITAGLLVLIGSILSYSGITNAIIIPTFVGAGLLFAGITDTCGLAMLLSRMPWNNNIKSKTCSSSTCTKNHNNR